MNTSLSPAPWSFDARNGAITDARGDVVAWGCIDPLEPEQPAEVLNNLRTLAAAPEILRSAAKVSLFIVTHFRKLSDAGMPAEFFVAAGELCAQVCDLDGIEAFLPTPPAEGGGK